MFSLEEMSNEFWWMLSHIGIYQNEEETCVEKLGKEYSICNGGKSLTVSIFTYPGDKTNDDFLEDCVECNNDNCDQKRKEFSILNITEVHATNWLWLSVCIIWILVCLSFVYLVCLFNLTEALENVCVVSLISILFQLILLFEFSESINL